MNIKIVRSRLISYRDKNFVFLLCICLTQVLGAPGRPLRAFFHFKHLKAHKMQTIFKTLLIISIASFVAVSCGDKEKNIVHSEKSDLEWKLAWSDEFDKDSINAENWNYQVVEAGRFNEEWQRYTNSSENAYIQDDCLVIRAIHESEEHGMDQYTSARLHQSLLPGMS